jgi:hypothetical protein
MRGLGLVVFATCLLLVWSGHLSAADDELGTVEGTVTYKGQPVVDCTITFHLKGDQFVGAKIKEGKYRVDRVPAGKVIVTLVEKKGRLPAKYAAAKTSPLSVVIKKGKNAADFEIAD